MSELLMIPTTIRVLGQTYVVRVEPDEHAPLDPHDAETFDALGHCDRSRLRISLRGPDGMAPGKARETLLHEVIHAVIGTARIEPFGDLEAEETLVRSLAPLLLAVLRDNPDLVAALVADETLAGHGEVVAEGASDHAH